MRFARYAETAMVCFHPWLSLSSPLSRKRALPSASARLVTAHLNGLAAILTLMGFMSSLQSQAAQVFSTMTLLSNTRSQRHD
jgi:hypothetical protein